MIEGSITLPRNISSDSKTGDQLLYEHIASAFNDITRVAEKRYTRSCKDWHGLMDSPYQDPYDTSISIRPLFQVINYKFARDTTKLLEQTPFWPIYPNDVRFKAHTDTWIKLVDHYLEMGDWPMYLERCKLSSLMCGNAALLPVWRVRPEVHMVTDIRYDEDKDEVVMEDIRDVRLAERMSFKFFAGYNYAIDPTVGFEIQKAKWAMAREIVSVDELKSIVDLGKVDGKTEAYLEGVDSDVGNQVLSALNRASMSPSDTVPVDYIFFPNAFKMFIPGLKGEPAQVVKDLPYNPWTKGKIPLTQFINYVDPINETSAGVSENQVISKLAFHLNRAINTHYNLLRQVQEPIWVYDKASGIDPNDLIARAGGAKIGIANTDGGDLKSKLDFLRPPQFGNESEQLMGLLQGSIEKLTNMNAVTMGQLPTPKQQTGVVQAAQQNPDIILAKQLEIDERAIGRIGSITAAVIAQNAPLEDIERMIGPMAMNLVTNPQTGDMITPDEIEKGYRYKHLASARVRDMQSKFVEIREFINLVGKSGVIWEPGLQHLLKKAGELLQSLSQEDIDIIFAQMQQQMTPPGAQGQSQGQGQGQGQPPQPVDSMETVIGNRQGNMNRKIPV